MTDTYIPNNAVQSIFLLSFTSTFIFSCGKFTWSIETVAINGNRIDPRHSRQLAREWYKETTRRFSEYVHHSTCCIWQTHPEKPLHSLFCEARTQLIHPSLKLHFKHCNMYLFFFELQKRERWTSNIESRIKIKLVFLWTGHSSTHKRTPRNYVSYGNTCLLMEVFHLWPLRFALFWFDLWKICIDIGKWCF